VVFCSIRVIVPAVIEREIRPRPNEFQLEAQLVLISQPAPGQP
jgi:hypothetical protein